MKVILAGATGHIGSAVLSECLTDLSITSLIILTRRPLPDLPSKAQTIIIDDFTAYPQATIQTITSADAAIWCLGTKTGDETIDIDFPMTFINHIKVHKPPRFRFVQLGGAFSEFPADDGQPERSLWVLARARRIRGAAEAKVLASADGGLEVFLVKPGGVLAPGGLNRCMQWVFGDSLAVMNDELAKVMVQLAKVGGQEKILSSREVVRIGRELSASRKA